MRNLYLKFSKYLPEMDQFIRSHKRVYLYGAGCAAGKIISLLGSKYGNIAGCIVTQKSGQLHSFMGYKVYTVEEVEMDISTDGVILAVAEEKQKEIMRELRLKFGSVDLYEQKLFFRNEAVQKEKCVDAPNKGSFFYQYKVLDEIGIEHETDKSSKWHDYLRKYEMFLQSFRDKELTFLELGVFKGCSLRMWGEYFKRGRVIGVDIDEACRGYEGNNRKVILADLDEEENVHALKDLRPTIVLDDASHIWTHQLMALLILFPVLPSGGIYILEDIETSFPEDGFCGYDDAIISPYEFCSKITEIVTRGHAPEDPENSLFQLAGTIGEQVEMVSWINGSCIIVKR